MPQTPDDPRIAGNLMLRTLDADARERVLALARPRRFARGETLIQEGAPDREVFLLLDGEVEVQTMQEGFIVTLNEFRAGTIFGEVAGATGSRRTATVVARAAGEALVFPGDALVAELRRHPTAGKLLEHITRHRRQEKQERSFGGD